MITKIHLERFKNFHSTDLKLGPFSLLIGVNASGKSNLREAFRFLHGIARGYSIADIIGEKFIGGALQWEGIRGGYDEIAFRHSTNFWIEVTFNLPGDSTLMGTYRIDVDLHRMGPRVSGEYLKIEGDFVFLSAPDNLDPRNLVVTMPGRKGPDQKKTGEPVISVSTAQPVLTQIEDKMKAQNGQATEQILHWVRETITIFSSMRFLSLDPAAMRIPSLPGQTLGDRGENLSSVLQAICEDPIRKAGLMEWVKELTPMDVKDFLFLPDQAGKILVSFVETGGDAITAYSASDGTLRFLGLIAALLGSQPGSFYFIEEVENGLHPARLSLLLDLIERQTGRAQTQIVASTHSPQLLRLLSKKSLESASLVYRLPDHYDAKILRIFDLPEQLRRVIQDNDIAQLYESGWFENTVDFLSSDEPEDT